MTADSVGLLTFTRNNADEGIDLLRRLPPGVSEAVVVDSSDPPEADRLVRGLSRSSDRVVRAIPTGYANLLIPLGVDEVHSAWVLHCDPDEEVSPGLTNRLQHLESADGYVVPRFEPSLDAFSYHLRLFRRDRFVPPNPTYGFPRVNGKVVKLPSDECFVHRRRYGPSLDRDYKTRVMDLESIERPLDRLWLMQVLPILRARRARDKAPPLSSRSSGELLSPTSALLASLAVSVFGFLRTGSPRFAEYLWRYHRARAMFWATLSSEERSRRSNITRDVRGHGGLTHYLGFDDPPYVRNLTESYSWDRSGIEVLHELIRHRFEKGIPMPRWSPARIGDRGSGT